MPDGAKKSGTAGVLTILLFAVYALLLVAIVLFKFPFQYQLTESSRQLNLIPFSGAYGDHRGLGIGDLVGNVLIFLPLGLYLSMLKREWSFGTKTLVIAATSVAFETIQFVFAIGKADITDVLCNTVGGMVGVGLYAASSRILKTRTNRVLTVVALVGTVLALAFFTFLRLHSR